MAPSLDELFEQQQLTGQKIQDLIRNYKKDSAARKTEKYYEERIQRLIDEFKKFEETDNKILTTPNLPSDHNYFLDDYFKSIKEVSDHYHNYFLEKLRAFKQGNFDVVGKPTDSQPTPPLSITATTSKDHNITKTNETEQATSSVPNVVKIMRRQRAVIQSLLRLLDSLENVDDNIINKSFVEVKIQSITRYWAQVEEHHQSIWEDSDDPTTLGYNIQEYVLLEERVQHHLIQLTNRLTEVSNIASSSGLPTTCSALKLPKITLPKFDGDYAKWRQFFDLYTQMVHNQPISNCQKMWYLKNNVIGEAEKLIRHLTVSEENYNSAYKMLQDRYENPRLLASALINKLLHLPSLATEFTSSTAIKTMHDTTQECLMGLENLGISTTQWDPLLLPILLKKVDRITHTLYEQSLKNPKELQSIKEYLSFLELRFQSLEALGTKSRKPEEKYKQLHSTLTSVIESRNTCAACNESHALFHCQTFLKMSLRDRSKVINKHNLCSNCLKAGHQSSKCTSRGCKKCNKLHNTLIHPEPHAQKEDTPKKASSSITNKKPISNTAPINNEKAIENSVSLTTSTQSGQHQKSVLLGTARVKLITTYGNELECRAILDSGSQINIISERIAKQLGITASCAPTYIQGIGQDKQRTKKRINVQLRSRVTGFSTRVEAFILDHIISPQPTQLVEISQWSIPNNIQLADPIFHRPDRIDLLLGAELFFQLLCVGQIKLGNNLPTLQNTVFGWIAVGKIDQPATSVTTCGICSEEDDLTKAIEKFWAIEEVETPNKGTLTVAQKECDTQFIQTVQRNHSGRFVVSLPFSNHPSSLGQSREIALRRFMLLERKLARNDELRQQYIAFMNEYINLGHMEEVEVSSITTPHYFLPHHSVLKPDSSTTKLRVVFDASAKTSTNISLNDILHAGPRLQDDLFTILLRFRLPRFVFTADIQQMYRQILIQENDRKLQLIWWRSDPNDTLKCYQLRTVTYGTSAAPYLAIKSLQMLAQEEEETYPVGSEILKRDFYVDDVMTGADNLNTVRHMQAQLTAILKKAGFHLRKWCANHPQLLQNIPPTDQEIQLDFTTDEDSAIKTLGLSWMPKLDQFGIKYNPGLNKKVTKRTIASDIARFFDPLGILGPVIVTAKIFMQQLWELNLDWDAALPLEYHTKWITFRDRLPILSQIKFPRHVFAGKVYKIKQLHIFADASERAYGAAVYLRSTSSNGNVIVRLLCAKSRVAPTKRITLPRLELCAAKLATELATRVKKDLKMENTQTYFWTDSEIVLAWINSSSTTFQTFVGNRIASIQRLSLPQQWRHVRSKENPADPLSRGIAPEALSSCNLWFYGPPFLHGNESIWPASYQAKSECQLEKKRIALPATVSNEEFDIIYKLDHKGSFRKLQRIVAYVLRFAKNAKMEAKDRPSHLYVTCQELEEALHTIIRTIQRSDYKEELKQLKNNKDVMKTSCISSLAPLIDDKGIIRVGGRLENSMLSFEAKHPMLLPYADPLTKLLMTAIHKENLHAGPQALLAITRQRFWPLRGKIIARSIVQHCVICAKSKPKMLSQFMGNLPVTRVQPARPFINSGVDFCGPIKIHHKIRGKRPHKAYLSVFCCFATKAVHLEIVGDLSTDAFIGALKRFMGRRGNCQKLYCDNATNFVGARNQLQELTETIYSNKARETIAATCSGRGIEFHFIPPRAPHFGGLWEAAVKSAKTLLLKTIAERSLTYEELETIVIEIEAILNSRPLTQMSNDPNDLSVLTPGHFLIGEPITATTDVNARELKTSLTTRWKLITEMKQEFWRRWSREYLNELQYRYKWKERCQNVNPGDIVMIKEDNLAGFKWKIGRIEQVHKGNDGLVRVADVKTATGTLSRAIHSLSPLPCNDDKNETSKNDEQSTNQPYNKHENKESDRKRHDEKKGDSKPKRMRTTYSAAILNVLLACLVIPSVQSAGITTQQFDSKPGIYFENIGTASFISTNWDIIAYYNLRPYWMELSALENGIKALEHLCQQSKQKSACSPILNHFRHLQAELQEDNILLGTRRTRRGAIDIVGNIANSLFGVLDSKYAEQMSETIDAVNKNENHLLALIKNQTSIIDSTINIVRRDQATVEKKFKEIDDHITQIINRINQTGEDVHGLRINQLFTTLSIQLSLIIHNLQRTQTAVIDVLTNIHHGKISPLLVTPQQFSKELNLIRPHLSPTLRLPTIQEGMLQLYKIMTAAAGIVRNHVIVKITIPLVNVETFDLLKLTPIPTVSNGTLIAIQPCATYIAFNPHQDSFHPMTDKDLELCKTTETQQYLCPRMHPLYHKIGSKCACETNLINNTPEDECNTQKIEGEFVWIQLTNPNNWINTVTKPSHANVLCKDENIHLTLQGSALLKISPDCVLKSDLVTIQGTHIYTSKIKSTYKQSNNIITITVPTEEAPMNRSLSTYQVPEEQMQILKELVSSQVQQEASTNLEFSNMHQLSVGYVALALVMVIICGVALKYLTIWKCKQKSTQLITKNPVEQQQIIMSTPSQTIKPIPIPRPRKPRKLDFSVDVETQC